jgi:hypothetical protein
MFALISGKGDPLAVGQFIAGFSECIRQIQKFGSKDNEHHDDESSTGDKHANFDLALRHQLTQSFKGDDPLRRNSSPRLKTVSSSSAGSPPLSHHSPTGSSLSPKSVSNLSPLGSDGESPRKSEPKTDDESNSGIGANSNLNSRVFSPAATHPYRVPLRLPPPGAMVYDASHTSLNSRPSAQDQINASAAALLQQMSALPSFNSNASHWGSLAVQHQLQLLGSRHSSLWRPF